MESSSGEGGFSFTFYRDSREDVLINVPVNQEQQKIITNTYAYVYSLLKEDPTQTREALAKRSGKTIRTIQRILAKLSAEGKIKRIGSNKTGYWEVLDIE